MKFNSDSQGITKFIHALEDIQTQFEYKPQDFFILLEPTGGYYSYLVVRVLLDRGYSIDKQIASLLYGNKEEGYKPHPYTKILMSFPIMSESMACTFIGAIGDIERFSTYLELKKYLGVAAENKISGTSVFKSRQTYEGVRDTRRVLFLMTLLLISPKISENSFRVYYKRLVDRGSAKRKAIGHVCDKIAQVLYSYLKNNEPYDPFKHASKMGVILNGDKVRLKIPVNLEDYERQADELADDDVL